MMAAAVDRASTAFRRRCYSCAISFVRQTSPPSTLLSNHHKAVLPKSTTGFFGLGSGLRVLGPSPATGSGVQRMYHGVGDHELGIIGPPTGFFGLGSGLRVLGPSPATGSGVQRMYHGVGDHELGIIGPQQSGSQQSVIGSQQSVIGPQQSIIGPQQGVIGPQQRVIGPNNKLYMFRPIPLLSTDWLSCPDSCIAPISQVSDPRVIFDDKKWTLHEFISQVPIWKRVSNPLVNREAYVMNELWRWCLRSMAGVIAANNNLSVTIAPAIFKENFRVSSRTFEASLIDPIGYKFSDCKLEEILHHLKANAPGVGFMSLAELIIQLTNEYQPGVPIPPDSEKWVRRMFAGFISYEDQESFVNDPCLLQPYGRLGFTNHAYNLFTTIIPCNFGRHSKVRRAGDEVLLAMSKLRGYDGRFWGKIMMRDPLHRYHYVFANKGSLPPEEQVLVKSQPTFAYGLESTPPQFIYQFCRLGKKMISVLRAGMNHSIESEVWKKLKASKENDKLRPFTLLDVIEHQHCNFHEFPSRIIKIMSQHNCNQMLYMDHYFYNHRRFVPALEGKSW